MFNSQPHTYRKHNGFTLVEMSIVLVIIGLIVGGVLVGRDLIRAAKVISVVSDVNSFKSAIIIFKSKYAYLPGDLPNASEFWPDCDTPATNCNGNGDREIDFWDPTFEGFRAWQQLSDGQLIKGNYTGVRGPASGRYLVDENAPSSKIDGGLYGLYYDQGDGGDKYNRITLAGIWDDGVFEKGVLTPAEAKSIEEKMGDDQIAGSGKIRGFERTGCVDWPNPTTYKLTNTDPACALFFSID